MADGDLSGQLEAVEKRVLVGPGALVDPHSSGAGAELAWASGVNGQATMHELTDSTAISSGKYTITLSSLGQSEERPSLRSSGKVVVLLQLDGVAEPDGPTTCLEVCKPQGREPVMVLGPFEAKAGDRLWAVIEDRGRLAAEYQLEVEYREDG
tara:strand:- start:72 stop:530 length:459 start_codon:yes stop_codon:yes gene_type:complete